MVVCTSSMVVGLAESVGIKSLTVAEVIIPINLLLRQPNAPRLVSPRQSDGWPAENGGSGTYLLAGVPAAGCCLARISPNRRPSKARPATRGHVRAEQIPTSFC